MLIVRIDKTTLLRLTNYELEFSLAQFLEYLAVTFLSVCNQYQNILTLYKTE